jgi:hypothetical protein
MNEEEKQAYNYLEKYIEWETLGERNLEGDIKTILDLVKKQQNKLEYLKTLTREYEAYKLGEGDNILIASKEWFNDGYFEENFISKDKIRDIIFEFIPKSNHEAELRTKIINLLGE